MDGAAAPSGNGVSLAARLPEQSALLDIDADDISDPLNCPAYADQIIENLLSSEVKHDCSFEIIFFLFFSY